MEAKALTTQDLTTQDLTTDLSISGDLIAADSHVSVAAQDGTVVEADLPAEVADKVAASPAGQTVAPGFDEFAISEPICAALAAAGITKAFPIQALTLPVALDKHDVIGQARTGTGKTLAFAIPILQHLIGSPRGKPGAPQALVVVPTRELAIQVADDLRIAAARTETNVVTLYGGRAYEPQIEALATVDVVVSTPGRLLDLARQGQLHLGRTGILVLDEADRMLDLGFLPDVEAILRLTPASRQTMLFSATMPSEIVTLARRHMNRPMHIRAEHHDEPAHVPTTDQHVFRAHHLDKVEVLARVLQAQGRGLTIVFCRTRRSCDQVTAQLTERGFAAAAVHGDLGQSQRERALRAFRNGKVDVLVATDVAARGLDVDDVTHVVNNECPEDEKAYLHRTGRTGRAGRTGVAVTFVDWQDMARWKLINDALGLGQPEPLETYSTSGHLYTALGIPAGAKGSLPRSKRDRVGLEAEELEDIGETGKVRSRRTGGSADRGSAGRSRGERGSAGRSRGERGTGERRAGSGRTRARKRTRGGSPVRPGGSPAAVGGHAGTGHASTGHAGASHTALSHGQASDEQPRRRSRRNRPAAHTTDAQGSTRPASTAEQRDIEAS